jgi:tetratricopeptide (TPR) repeat protein
MKKIVLLTVALAVTCLTFSQVKMADLSPRSTVNQKVGLTDFTLEYSRPSVRDRVIFGNEVPYGDIWRTGANMNSTLEFSSTINFSGKELAAGKYAIYAKPEAKMWTIYLYSELDNGGVPDDWSADKVVAEVILPVKMATSKQESFSISFENLKIGGADLQFAWENVVVDLPIEVPSKEMSLASIKKTMAGPSDRDYYSAASFYLEEKIELEKAREYITKAVEMRGPEAFWYTRKKALIEYEIGDIPAAIKSAELSLAEAKKANYGAYIKMNEESLKAWKKVSVSKKAAKK